MTFSVASKAQNNENSGVYLNADDYKNHRLSYTLHVGDFLQPNEFWNGPYLDVTISKKLTRLEKDKIFGYRLEGHDYRISNRHIYLVEDTARFMLYSISKLLPRDKGYKPGQQYYFSVSAGGALHLLTIDNLLYHFEYKPAFCNALRRLHSDLQLSEYDEELHQYRVKLLFAKRGTVPAN